MRRLATVVVLAVLTGGLSVRTQCQEPEDPSKADLKKLQGAWKVVKVTRGGKEMKKDLDKVEATFEKDALTIGEEGRKGEKATVTLDGKKNPKQIDIAPGEKAERKVLGIYKIDKEEVTLCYSRPGSPRPTKFDDPEAAVLVLRRKK
jgi:uncharacterized protein (TIGR03067 family)